MNAATLPDTGLLTEPQLAELERDGFLHMRELMPARVCDDLVDRTWERLAPAMRDDPATWPNGAMAQPTRVWDIPEVKAAYTPRVAAIVDQLVGEGLHDQSLTYQKDFGPIVRFPRRDRQWKPPPPHVDQHGPRHRTLVLSMLAYLHDIPSRAGGTAFWPGEYRAIEDKAVEWRRLPCDLFHEGFTPTAAPTQIEAHKGDVVLYLRNTLHSGTANVSDTPRFAHQIMIHLNAQGEWHARTGRQPRTFLERITYDRHFEDYLLFNYFGCRPQNNEEY